MLIGPGRDVKPAETPMPPHVDTQPNVSQDAVKAAVERPRKQDAEQQPNHEQVPTAPNHPAFNPQAVVQPHAETTAGSGRSAAGAPEAADTTPVATAPEPPKATGPARDIRLAVAGGEQRVEVKLSDRGGELQVAVRTPDGHLAERLRENLPALSSRLAESGIRAETWHPSASADSDLRQTREVATANSGEQADSQPGHKGREQQDEGEARPPRVTEEIEHKKEKGKEFAWLMSTQA